MKIRYRVEIESSTGERPKRLGDREGLFDVVIYDSAGNAKTHTREVTYDAALEIATPLRDQLNQQPSSERKDAE
jgi:hypothetical protein